ncbi:MAG: hypothetical protein IKI03_09950 [Clostridia bacterium]|nr:hypothetical protein [Clostridia bacterium]
MKRLFAVLIAAIMIFALVACGNGGNAETGKASENETGSESVPATESAEGTDTEAQTESEKATETAEDTASAGMPNPIVEVDSAEAFEELGVSLSIPGGAENVRYSIIDGKIAEVDFKYGEHEYCLRGSKTESDFAGIEGEAVSEKDLPGHATLTGVADGETTLYKVEWSRNGVNYSLTNTDGAAEDQLGMTYEDVR